MKHWVEARVHRKQNGWLVGYKVWGWLSHESPRSIGECRMRSQSNLSCASVSTVDGFSVPSKMTLSQQNVSLNKR